MYTISFTRNGSNHGWVLYTLNISKSVAKYTVNLTMTCPNINSYPWSGRKLLVDAWLAIRALISTTTLTYSPSNLELWGLSLERIYESYIFWFEFRIGFQSRYSVSIFKFSESHFALHMNGFDRQTQCYSSVTNPKADSMVSFVWIMEIMDN